MTPWRLIVLAAGIYALGLLVTAPATLIDAELRQASAGRLRLAEARGTVWSGTGAIELRGANLRTGVAKQIGWRLRPAYLLRGELRYQVTLDREFPVTITPSRVEVADADVSLLASVLGLGVPQLAPLELTGELRLHIRRFALAREAMHGNATLQWQAAGSALTSVSPLGDYELNLAAGGSEVRASLRTLRGPLQVDGGGSWAIGTRPKFQATARIAPQHRQQLAPLLRLIAVERGDGSFALRLK